MVKRIDHQRAAVLIRVPNGQLAPLHGRVGGGHTDCRMENGRVALDQSCPMGLQLGFIPCLQRMRFLGQIPQNC